MAPTIPGIIIVSRFILGAWSERGRPYQRGSGAWGPIACRRTKLLEGRMMSAVNCIEGGDV